MNKNREVMSVTITKCTPAFISASDLRPLVAAGLLSQFEIVHGGDQTRVTLTFELPADEQDKKEIGDPTNSVFAVAFGNYYPDEIEGLYRTFELASERVKLLGPGWEVREMPVHG